MKRIISWFSCGAASAVATKLVVQEHGDRVIPVYCNTLADEHPDNQRFLDAVSKWIGMTVQIIASTKYRLPSDVFDGRKYMSGPKGAPCTVELKKIPRFQFQQADDIHVFGFTADEPKRIAEFEQNNPELYLNWILRDGGYTKDQCFGILKYVGIELPAMYKLGYLNNNCIGCVKATSPWYWNKIRKDFPTKFQHRAEQSRRLGVRLVRVHGKRIFLDELPETVIDGRGRKENVSCGPQCGQQ